MKGPLTKLFLYIVGLTITISANRQPQLQPRSSHGRILGGRPAYLGEFPAISALTQYASGRIFCGGSVISKRSVLTAAHCLQCAKQPSCFSEYGIMVGDIDRVKTNHSPESRQHLQCERVINHKDYIRQPKRNDIALVIVRGLFIFSKNVKRIPLSIEPPAQGLRCQTVGFGVTEHGDKSNILLATRVFIQPDTLCKGLYPRSFNSTQNICAGDLSGQNDSCFGDSGGPLICEGHLGGIVSYGRKCGLVNYSAVYTKVAYFRSWVANQQKYHATFQEFNSKRTVAGKVQAALSQLLLILSVLLCSIIYLRYQ